VLVAAVVTRWPEYLIVTAKVSSMVNTTIDWDRRTLLRRSVGYAGGVYLLARETSWDQAGALWAADDATPQLRLGLVTDLHYADKAPAGTRHYRETIDKLAEAAGKFALAKPKFVVELGDLIDAADSVAVEQGYLKRIQREFSQIACPQHCVLGNHCVDTLTKREFLDGVSQPKSFYGFDAGGYHFVVLDACFRSDGRPYQRKNFDWTDPNLPAHEVEWLKADLAATDKKTVVFVHQRLDPAGTYSVRNAAEVRRVLEESDKVLAVFQGHSHENHHALVNGIHYCTLVGMVEGTGKENNGYAILDLLPGDVLRLSGYRRQQKYQWGAK